MKKYFIISTIILTLLLTKNNSEASISNNKSYYGGCPSMNYKPIVTVNPETECIKVNANSNNCFGNLYLTINSTCNKKYYIYDKNGEKIIFDTSKEFNKYDKSEILDDFMISYYINDFRYIWGLNLVNIDDKNDIIKIKGYDPIGFIKFFLILEIISTILVIYIVILILKKLKKE